MKKGYIEGLKMQEMNKKRPNTVNVTCATMYKKWT